jgi:hypothetical protein
MSYSQNYQATVPYSGSIQYNYPASQNGGSGTAHYSGDVPVSVTINVNTVPFDGSVDHFNHSIDGLTGTVIAMNAAQCAAINQTTEEVSKSLIDGFFGTINTEISQQLQALDSAIKAGFGLIQSQGEAVTGKKTAMEADYNRIASRYVNLFADLDNECYKRIYALDKYAFNLSEKVQKELLCDTSTNAAALNLLGIEDESSLKMLLLISGTNRKTVNVLHALHDYVNQERKIASLVESFLFNETEREPVPVYLPVVWAESDLLEGNSTGAESFIPAGLDAERQKLTAAAADDLCSDASRSQWSRLDDAEKSSLDKEFKALAESQFAGAEDEAAQRVYRMMLSLWENTAMLSL